MRILYAQKWKDIPVHTTEKWMGKVMEIEEMAKLTDLIRENKISSFVSSWKLLMDIELEIEKKWTFDIGFCWFFIIEMASIC